MQPRQSLELAQARLRAKYQPRRRRRGRPELEIDPVAVYLLARDGQSARAIARYLDCDPGTIRRRFGGMLHWAWEYERRWSWLGADSTLQWLQREAWPGALYRANISHIRRGGSRGTGPRRRRGRPQVAINKERVLELWLQGYAPRGIAREVGCSVRTLQRRFPALLAGYIAPGTYNRLLFRSAIAEGNLPALLLFARRLVRQDLRRAEREEEAEIQKRIRGER